jgi:hypothetical protein
MKLSRIGIAAFCLLFASEVFPETKVTATPSKEVVLTLPAGVPVSILFPDDITASSRNGDPKDADIQGTVSGLQVNLRKEVSVTVSTRDGSVYILRLVPGKANGGRAFRLEKAPGLKDISKSGQNPRTNAIQTSAVTSQQTVRPSREGGLARETGNFGQPATNGNGSSSFTMQAVIRVNPDEGLVRRTNENNSNPVVVSSGNQQTVVNPRMTNIIINFGQDGSFQQENDRFHFDRYRHFDSDPASPYISYPVDMSGIPDQVIVSYEPHGDQLLVHAFPGTASEAVFEAGFNTNDDYPFSGFLTLRGVVHLPNGIEFHAGRSSILALGEFNLTSNRIVFRTVSVNYYFDHLPYTVRLDAFVVGEDDILGIPIDENGNVKMGTRAKLIFTGLVDLAVRK